GDIDPKVMERKIKNSFSDMKNSNHATPVSRLIPDNNNTRIANVRDKEIASNSVEIYYLQRQLGAVTTEERKAQLIDWMVRLMFNHNASRHLLDPLTKLLGLSMREDWITSLRKASVFHADFSVNDKKAAFVELNRIIRYYANFGFEEETLKTAKEELLALNENNYKERDSILSAPIASRIVGTLLNGAVFVDDDYDYAMAKKLLGEISLDEVNKRYREIVADRDRVIVFMGSDGKKVSKEEAEKLITQGEKEVEVKAEKSKRTVELPPRPSKCAKIVENKFDKENGIYHYTLENNVSVDFKPTTLKKNEVFFSAISQGGDSIIPIEELDNLHKAAKWVVSSIPGKMSSDEMETFLAGKKLSYDFGIERYYEIISGGSSSADLETLLHLISLQIKEPKIDMNVARQLRNRLFSQLIEMERNPGYRFEKAVSNFYYRDNPRILFDSNESIEKLDTQKMLTLFKEKFSDMNHFHFILVGDTTPEKVEKLISCYLGNLSVSHRTEHYDPNPYPYRKGKQHFTGAYNSSNIANINLKYRTILPYSVHTAAVINALQSILTIRLRKHIREEKSGTYGIGVSCNLIREMKDTLLCDVGFAADPARRDELVKAVKQSISEFVKEGPTPKEIAEMKKVFDVEFEQMKQMNGYWLTMLQLTAKYDTPLEAYLNIDKEVNSVTREEIQDIAQKIFSGDLLISERVPEQKMQK
ncbi:MAG TPA: insulinase family protein, partial [Epsilonproteobacteria bacterium]|nr:insulinase family protein [Campylobacterota bacterium]